MIAICVWSHAVKCAAMRPQRIRARSGRASGGHVSVDPPAATWSARSRSAPTKGGMSCMLS
eukprot:2938672-Alexandrium_andersonii.AAC.1